MMIRLLAILIALSGILRGQSTVETELWTLRFDASVTAPQRASVTKAATHLGWLIDRKFPDFAPWCKNGAGTLSVITKPYLNGYSAVTYYAGPAAQIGTRLFPMSVWIELNDGDWTATEFKWGGPLVAYEMCVHELFHALGLMSGGYPDLNHDGFWWGQYAQAAFGGPVPLPDTAHFPNEGIFYHDILSPIIEPGEPQWISPALLAMCRDLGYEVKTTDYVSLDKLFLKRTDPYRDQPVIITAPNGEIIPHNP